MKSIHSIIVSVISVLIFSSMAIFATNNILPFNDVKDSSWYYDEVQTVYNAGIMEGKTSTSFDPTANMSRAEFVTVLARLSGDALDGKGTSLTFSDTDTEAWYADYVAWGVENEMVKGLPKNKFAPAKAVSRQEMAVFIDRFVNYKNIVLADNSKINSFNDSAQIADYAKDAVETMRKSGIITGDQNGNFNPANNASRAEVATVITRILLLLDNDVNMQPPDIDRDNFDIQKAFMYCESSWDGLPYRIYVPQDYSNDKEYPVTFFIGESGVGSDNTSQLHDAEVLFENTNSLIFDSIVVTPQIPMLWSPGMATDLADLIDHINVNYSTDTQRIYLIGARYGAFTFWKMMLSFPEKASAVLFVHGIGPTVYGDDQGNPEELIDAIPNELTDIPIHFLHDVDDGVKFEWTLGPYYGKMLSYALVELGGFTNIYLTETSGYGANISHNFITKDDATLLEWLFAQRRVTK